MRKFLPLLVVAMTVSLVSGAMAQDKMAPPTKGKKEVKKGNVKTLPDGAAKVTGFTKGTASGTTLTLGTSKGTYTVDASKATVTYQGKPFTLDKIVGGSSVSATGLVKGTTLTAKEIKVNHLRSDKKKGTPNPVLKK